MSTFFWKATPDESDCCLVNTPRFCTSRLHNSTVPLGAYHYRKAGTAFYSIYVYILVCLGQRKREGRHKRGRYPFNHLSVFFLSPHPLRSLPPADIVLVFLVLGGNADRSPIHTLSDASAVSHPSSVHIHHHHRAPSSFHSITDSSALSLPQRSSSISFVVLLFCYSFVHISFSYYCII